MYGLFPTMENSFKEVVTKDSFTNRAELLPIRFKNSRKVWILKSSIFVKGTQLLIIRKIGKQFAVGLFFKEYSWHFLFRNLNYLPMQTNRLWLRKR